MLVLSLILGCVVPGLAPHPNEPPGVRAVGGDEPTENPNSPHTERATFQVDAIERTTTTFKLPPGPRTIQCFEWRPAPSSTGWMSARLRIVWDHEDPESAAVDLPLGLFVTPRESSGSLESSPRSAFENCRHMPYRRGGRLILETNGPVRGTIQLVSTPQLTTGWKYLWARPSGQPWPIPVQDHDRDDASRTDASDAAPTAVYQYWSRSRPVPKSEPVERD